MYGCILGAVVLTWVNYTGLTEIGNAVNNTFGTSIELPHYQFLIFGFVLVLMMLFRRDGFLPAARAEAVARPWHEQLEKIGHRAEADARR